MNAAYVWKWCLPQKKQCITQFTQGKHGKMVMKQWIEGQLQTNSKLQEDRPRNIPSGYLT
jgi:hypothetical protein